MGNKSTIVNDDYENCCSTFNEYLMKTKNDIDLEKEKNEINKKIEEKAEKAIIFGFIKKLLEKEKKGKILNKMQDVFASLIDQYDQIHRKEEDDIKKFSEKVDEKEKNIINAIYLSKILDDDSIENVKINDYAVYLYGNKVVEDIEDGNNEYIDEDFKKYNEEEFDINQKEVEEKFNEICKNKNIDLKNYENQDSPQNKNNVSNNKNLDSNKIKQQILDSKNNEEENKVNAHDENLNKKKYCDEELFKYYDIIFNIDSLENLKINGWQLESNDEGYKKYEEKKDKKNTVVSVIGNKNKGKSFILAKLSNIEIPDGFNITTKGLSVIYPKYEDKNIIFLDTAGFEIPLCENEEIFKFKTEDKDYQALDEGQKKNVSIKDYLNEDEYITQTMQFTRDRQNTDYFLQKFILDSADILLCIVNQLNLSDHKFLNRIQEENKDKKIFVIHNLKTLKKQNEVEDYINEILLKLVTSKLQKGIYIKIDDNKNNTKKENNIYYKQIFNHKDDKNKNREVIHLFMANDKSEAGDYYNNSTLEFIKNQIISFVNNKRFPIIEKVKDYLFNHSEEFFNDPLENIDDIKIIDDNNIKKLKYTGKPYELKECYVDELGNTNFIQTNYQPNYSVYKVKYKDENGESDKLIIDIEISGKIDTEDIKYPRKDNINGQNIITISGRRNLKKGDKKTEKKQQINNIAEYKANYFNDKNNMFFLRIYIPNEKCVIGSLYGRKFFIDNGLYRFIYNILENNNLNQNAYLDIDYSDDDDIYDE